MISPRYKKFPKWIIKESIDYKDKVINYDILLLPTSSKNYPTLPMHSIRICDIIRDIIPEPKIIIDAMAYIGTDSLNFIHAFPSSTVIAIEYDKEYFNTLVLNAKNITTNLCIDKGKVITFHSNCMDINYKFISNISFVYLDPPFHGGEIIIRNSFGKRITLLEVCNHIFSSYVSTIIIKLHIDCDMSSILESKMFNIQAFPIQKYNSTQNKNIFWLLVLTKS